MNHFVSRTLPTSFMVMSLIGFLFSMLIVTRWDATWGFTLSLVFMIWLVAAIYNFTHGPDEEMLDIHNSKKYLR